MQVKKVEFPGSQGAMLAAQLDLPDGEPRAYALFAHCFTCNKNYKAIHNVGLALTESGIASFRFDFTGLGESEGDFGRTNFRSNVQDLVAAARFLEAEYRAPALLIGHSLGGAAVIHAASQVPSSKAVVTIAAPYAADELWTILHATREEAARNGYATVSIAGRPFRVSAKFMDDMAASALGPAIAQLNRALLIFQAPEDTTVPAENALRIFQQAHFPKSFVSLDGADHLLTKSADSAYVGRVIVAWSSRYLEQAA